MRATLKAPRWPHAALYPEMAKQLQQKRKLRRKKNVEGQKTKWLRAGQLQAHPLSRQRDGATLSSASISCRVNFNLQLFCDRRFGQHESPKLFLFSLALFFCILRRYTYFFVGSFFWLFGCLACWSTDISDSTAGRLPFGRGPFAISFNDRKSGRTDQG